MRGLPVPRRALTLLDDAGEHLQRAVEVGHWDEVRPPERARRGLGPRGIGLAAGIKRDHLVRIEGTGDQVRIEIIGDVRGELEVCLIPMDVPTSEQEPVFVAVNIVPDQ